MDSISNFLPELMQINMNLSHFYHFLLTQEKYQDRKFCIFSYYFINTQHCKLKLEAKTYFFFLLFMLTT